jgi:SM-20-related protein
MDALADGGLLAWDGVLDADACRAARELGRALPRARAATGKERRVDPAVRADAMRWVDGAPTPGLGAFLAGVERTLREDCFLAVAETETQFAEYAQPGAGYARHRDAFTHDDARMVTAIVYVHEHWQPGDGGRLRAWVGEQAVDVDPLPGRAVIFRSDRVEHAVLPSHAYRAAFTTWFRRRA